MFAVLRKLLSPSAEDQAAHTAYAALVAQARREFFYRECGVPDSLDGRFEMILLHLFLALRRLKLIGTKEAELFSRSLSEAFFKDMDRSLREIGVSDTGVSKRIKRMASAYFGRLIAYEAVFTEAEGFKAALERNVYATAAQEAAKAGLLAEYLQGADARLQGQEDSALLQGHIGWPEV